MSLEVITDRIPISTGGDAEIHDVTSDVAALVAKHRFREGHVLVFVPGSTGGITTLEYEPGLVKDLPIAMERIAPKGGRYHHEETWHDGNGHSHVRSAVVGCSLTVPFQEGRLTLGTWQQIVLIDFDNRPRQREIVVQLTGERGE
jgi:secondary thiamine-phosphate synthase enzyme